MAPSRRLLGDGEGCLLSVRLSRVAGLALATLLVLTVSVGFAGTPTTNAPPAAPSAKGSGTVQSTRLYTAPDLQAGGGLTARLSVPRDSVLAVFAILNTDPTKLYKGTVATGGREFSFRGLPVGKYDLLLLFENFFYEGLTLTRDPDTLTTVDRENIDKTIKRSVPFFDTKAIHRVAGTTGKEGTCRLVLQELRTRKILTQAAGELVGYQIRSLKLAWLADVGKTGWHLVNTREIVRTEVTPEARKGLLGYTHSPRLGNIRVTDTVKDLGTLNLDQKEAP